MNLDECYRKHDRFVLVLQVFFLLVSLGYFYRLIQRAENITLLYNTSSDGLNRGEESRFMLQLLVEGPHDITREYLEAGQSR